MQLPGGISRAKKFWAAALLLVAVVSAGAYSPPPSWDPMLMLNVTLDASNQLAVETTSYIIHLTVAPGAYDSTNKTYDLSAVTFDPAQPYAVLNGTAYSRVLGWYDQGTTGANGDNFYDTYAAQLNGNYVWIEKTGGSPELKTYFINEDITGDPGTPYTPILGTDGSSTQWRWDGKMDHNAYAVALRHLTAANQLFTATYHLYIGDAAGNPIAGYGDTNTTWRWQGPAVAVVPTPGIARTNAQVVISWTPTVTNLILVAAASPTTTNWTAVSNTPFSQNSKTTVTLDPSASQEFFRLQLTP
jgi:hypothetical protein